MLVMVCAPKACASATSAFRAPRAPPRPTTIPARALVLMLRTWYARVWAPTEREHALARPGIRIRAAAARLLHFGQLVRGALAPSPAAAAISHTALPVSPAHLFPWTHPSAPTLWAAHALATPSPAAQLFPRWQCLLSSSTTSARITALVF